MENLASDRKYYSKALDDSSQAQDEGLIGDVSKGSRSVNLHEPIREPDRGGRWRQRDGRSPRLMGGQTEGSDLEAPSTDGRLREDAPAMGLNQSAYHSLDQFENIAITTQSDRDDQGSTALQVPSGRLESQRRIGGDEHEDTAGRASEGWGEGLDSSSRPIGAAGGPDEPGSESSGDADEYGDKVDAFGGGQGDGTQPDLPGGVNSEWRDVMEMDSLPLMKSGYSLEADMKFGWKPTVKGKVLPIPLVFDMEDDYFDLDHYIEPNNTKRKYPCIYKGWRPADSLKMYKKLLNNPDPYHGSDFPFKVPSDLPDSIQKLLDQQMQETVLGGQRQPKVGEDGVDGQQKDKFEGMNPEVEQRVESGEILSFDSMFESGNLDRVVMVSPTEYDLYMRPDTNTRGHHQWFFFKVTSRSNLRSVKFNVINFTKPRSLYEYGMKVCICSVKEKELELARRRDKGQSTGPLDADTAGWKRGGNDVKYELSKLNKIIQRHNQPEGIQGSSGYNPNYTQRRMPTFYQMSFTYEFNYIDQDETYIAYSYPYTFTRLSAFMKELNGNKEIMKSTIDCTPLCQSLAGVDVPYLIVTSRAHEENFRMISKSEHAPDYLPVQQMKKTVVLTGRVHPGESNSSYMMEGFIKFITSNQPPAVELRKRLIFKIIPCTNPDGVIAGNYRVSMSGNDLNRRYQTPHAKLHPIVCAVKRTIKDEKPDLNIQDENQILAFIDMHGHSRKKNVFMYGPQFPIHDNRYLKMRVIPKLMSEKSEMFRFFSCKFRIQRSKEKTARVVLWREFNIMSCFTLEASFQGYFDHERQTRDFLHHHFFRIGEMLGQTLFETVLMREEDERLVKARRDEALRIKREKQKQQEKQEEKIKKIKQSNMRKREKGILSPSVSSEAVNIDDQQPNNSSNKNKDGHRLRKKMLNSNKKVGSSTNSGYLKQSDKKKKFKLTKKFKDDITPPLAPKPKKSNPQNDETENDSQDNIDDNKNKDNNIQRELLDEDSEEEDDENETQQERSMINLQQHSGDQIASSPFMDKFRMKHRTLKDLYQQIETDEKIDQPSRIDDDIEEINSQDSGENSAKEDEDNASDAYRSDDDINEQLLQQIQGKILGVLKCESTTLRIESRGPQKGANLKDSNSKKAGKPTKKESDNNLLQQKKILQSSEKQLLQQSSQKQSGSGKRAGGQLLPLQGAASDKAVSSGIKPVKRHHPRVADARKDRLRQLPISNPPQSVTTAVSHASAGGGVLLQMKNNNFNDRIMTQPYNKYQKKMYSGSSGGYHLQSLSSNTHQLFHRQFMHQQQQKQPVMRPPRQSHEDKTQAFSFYNFQARSQKAQMPLVQRLSDHGKDRKNFRGNRGRMYGQEDLMQPRDRHDQADEGSSSSHQGQLLTTFGQGRTAVTHVPSHTQIPFLDPPGPHRPQEPATSSQQLLRQPTHTMQLLYSTPQQPQPQKLESQANKYQSDWQQKQLPRAQRSAQFSQGNLQVGMTNNDGQGAAGFQRRSRRLVPAVDQYQPQHASSMQQSTAGFQHAAARMHPVALENLDKIPHHIPGILSGSGLCHEAVSHEASGQPGAGLRPGDASSALAVGAMTNYGFYQHSEYKQARTAGLPYSQPVPIGYYEHNRSGIQAVVQGDLVQGEGTNPPLHAEVGHGLGMRSTTSFTAQMHAKNRVLETFGESVSRQLAMSSSMGVTRAQDGPAERGQYQTPLGQLEAGQGNALGGGNLVDAMELNEIGGYVYGDQARTEPTLKERPPGIGLNQSRLAPPFAAAGASMTGIQPEQATKVGQRGSKLGRVPISRAIVVRGVAARVEGPRSQASGQGGRRGLSGRHMNAQAIVPGADYANPSPSKTQPTTAGAPQAIHLTDSGMRKSRVKHLRQIDLNDPGLDSSKTSLTGPQPLLLVEDMTTTSGLRSVQVPGRGFIVAPPGHKQGLIPPQALQPPSPSSSQRRRRAAAQNLITTGPTQKGRTIDLHPQHASNGRLPTEAPPHQHFAHLAPASAYSNNLAGAAQIGRTTTGLQASRPKSPLNSGAPDSRRITEVTEALRNQQKAQQYRPQQ